MAPRKKWRSRFECEFNKQMKRQRKKKLVTFIVTDPRGVSWHRQLKKPGDTITVDWNQSHSHVDRWRAQGRVRVGRNDHRILLK